MKIDGMDVCLEISKYVSNDNLAINVVTLDGELYSSLTVNVLKMPSPYALVDTNNFPKAEEFIKKYNLGEATGEKVASGFCKYPMYKFDLEALN